MIIDTHCHLTYLSDEELDAQIKRAVDAGVKKMICIGGCDNLEGSKRAAEISDLYPEIFFSVGIHPMDAGNTVQLDEIAFLANHPKCVGIGETGLDYYWGESPEDQQKELFLKSIQLAKNVDKPLIIHCRGEKDNPERCIEDTLKIIQDNFDSRVRGVFHCYWGDSVLAKRLAELNFSVSFPGTVTFKNAKDLRDGLLQIPLSQIMVETDAPYLTPEPFRGKPCEPWHTKLTLEKIANIFEKSDAEMARITTENAIRLFGLADQ